jgi:hypothetical protein
MYNLHAILLENDNVLIHTSSKTSNDDLFEECKKIYDFAKTNPPKCVIEMVTVTSLLAIDYYVKQYMSYYGIDHVRGGTYSQTTLSESQSANLEQELQIEASMQQIDPAPVGSVQMLHKIKYYMYSNRQCEISRAVLAEFEWFKETVRFSKMAAEYTCGNPGQIQISFSDEHLAKYERFLVLCKKLYEKVLLLRDEIECDYPEYLKYPRRIFDRYIYYSSSNDEVIHSYDTAMYMWGRFEYMCYILINKIDELEFDIANP